MSEWARMDCSNTKYENEVSLFFNEFSEKDFDFDFKY